MKKYIILLALGLLFTSKNYAAEYEYSVKAGFNIGGTAPMSLPASIRRIQSYNPTMSFSLEGNIKRYIAPRMGILTGLRFESKGMETNAVVRHYGMELNDNGNIIKGIFTGDVFTRVKNEYLTLPILFVYDLTERWDLKLGGYVSWLLRADFSGSASNGYIRNEATSPKIGVTEASYNFSSDVRKFNGGLEVGAEYRLYRNFIVYGDLTWALNAIFPASMTALNFDMYNVYLNLGFGYVF